MILGEGGWANGSKLDPLDFPTRSLGGGWLGGKGPVLGRLGYEIANVQLQNGARYK